VQWKLTWDDEFNKPSSLSSWGYDTGGNGWQLNQLQWYDRTNAETNSHGDLVITASNDGNGHQCWYGPCRYSSVRMTTLGMFSQTYGRFQARIELPVGAGLWPSFWLEGANIEQVGWPRCGEVDIVELNGKNPNLVQGYSHSPHHTHQGYFTLPKSLSSGFHVYGIDWTSKGITWSVDGYAYAHLNAYAGWPFDHPFYIILNLAVGGSWPGSPNSSTSFPAHMLVDWARVYQETAPKSR
jgi:beta-glucanase (GH16 family)